MTQLTSAMWSGGECDTQWSSCDIANQGHGRLRNHLVKNDHQHAEVALQDELTLSLLFSPFSSVIAFFFHWISEKGVLPVDGLVTCF
jgi:hypothetical protein